MRRHSRVAHCLTVSVKLLQAFGKLGFVKRLISVDLGVNFRGRPELVVECSSLRNGNTTAVGLFGTGTL
jgi:hypothetical protein